MIRIISGKYKSRQINTPAGINTRPTTSRVREAVFSALNNAYSKEFGNDSFTGARVWDTFAGSGALGLEALSRGAEVCVFTDVSASAIKCIHSNIDTLKIPNGEAIVHKSNCLSFNVCKRVFDEAHPNIVLIDAPYSFLPDKVYKIVENLIYLRENSEGEKDSNLLIYYEHSKNISGSSWENLDVVYSRKFGDIISEIFLA